MLESERRQAELVRNTGMRKLARNLHKVWLRKVREAENRWRARLRLTPTAPPILTRPERVVFVCKGNICRSAFAEYLFGTFDSGIGVASVGIDVRRSNASPERAVAAASRFGIDLTAHRSRPPRHVPDTPGTLYLTMEPWQQRAPALAAARRDGRVHLLAAWRNPPAAVVPDPYGREEEEFLRCFEDLSTMLRTLLDAFPPARSVPAATPMTAPPLPVKRKLLGVATSSPVRWLFRPWARYRVPVIMMHRFTRDEHHTTQTPDALLDRCLSFVKEEGFETLSLGDLSERLARGEVPRKAITFTVDDGYRDFGDVAFPVFQRHGMPATVFVASGFIDGTMWYWWDHLRYMFDHTRAEQVRLTHRQGIDLDLRWTDGIERRRAYRKVAEACKVVPDEVKQRVIEDLAQRLDVAPPTRSPEEYRGLSWERIRELTQHGVEFGGHTVTHPILSQIPEDRQRAEVLESLDAIERNTGVRPRTFSYPNGRLCDLGEAPRFLEGSGVVGAVTVEKDIVSRQTLRSGERPLLCLPRVPMPGTFERFVSLVSGITAARIALGLGE